VKGSALASRSDYLVCPHCERYELKACTNDSARCPSCGVLVSGAMLRTLRQVAALPDALGSHPCEECGHPEMRHLPDGVFHCPACRSEVLPLGAPPVDRKFADRGEAYRVGWLDGRFGGSGSFVENPNLARWENPLERLDYYRGHRAGREARQARITEKAELTRGELQR
jgi:ribosomal protein L37AE/L43A